MRSFPVRSWPAWLAARSYRLGLALMLAPLGLGIALLYAVPGLLAVGLAFTAFDALGPPRWVGLGNLAYLLHDSAFWNGVRASATFAAVALPLRLAVAFGLALLLYRPRPGVGLFRAAVYLPTVVPGVAYALLWLALLNPLYGPLGGAAVWLVGPAGSWLTDPVGAQAAVVLLALWTVGEGFVLLMAALQDVPRELHEAAAIDGAGRRTRFRHVILPLLLPVLGLVAVRDLVVSLQTTFLAAAVLTRGGPYYATAYLPYTIYLEAIEHGRLGYAAAMNLTLFVMLAGVVAVQFALARRWRGVYGDA